MPRTPPDLIAIADNCSAPSNDVSAALADKVYVTRGVALKRAAVMLAAGTGTSGGVTSRYTYYAAELWKNGR